MPIIQFPPALSTFLPIMNIFSMYTSILFLKTWKHILLNISTISNSMNFVDVIYSIITNQTVKKYYIIQISVNYICFENDKY